MELSHEQDCTADCVAGRPKKRLRVSHAIRMSGVRHFSLTDARSYGAHRGYRVVGRKILPINSKKFRISARALVARLRFF
jgi:hypothetical protein